MQGMESVQAYVSTRIGIVYLRRFYMHFSSFFKRKKYSAGITVELLLLPGSLVAM